MKKYPFGNPAFSLVEVSLAMGLTVFSLLALLGLLPIGLKSEQTARAETAASGILSTVTADLRATPPASASGEPTVSGQFEIPLPASPLVGESAPVTRFFSSDGTCTTTLASHSRYRLTLVFPTNGLEAKTATFVSLRVSWPAMAKPENAAGCVTTFLALDRN